MYAIRSYYGLARLRNAGAWQHGGILPVASSPLGDTATGWCRITSYNVCYTKLLRASGALNGVCRMLSLEEGPVQVEGLARMLRPYPLSGTPTFETAFMKSRNNFV